MEIIGDQRESPGSNWNRQELEGMIGNHLGLFQMNLNHSESLGIIRNH